MTGTVADFNPLEQVFLSIMVQVSDHSLVTMKI